MVEAPSQPVRDVFPREWWVTIASEALKRASRRIGRVPRKIQKLVSDHRVVSLKIPDARGNVLLSYVLEPFLLPEGEPLPNNHTQYWESLTIANAFLEQGYCVDVIHYQNQSFLPRKGYDFLIDARWNIERLGPILSDRCMKVLHIDTAHVLFQNAAEYRRLLDLQRRRGVTLEPRRHESINHGIDYADCATMLGNDFTYGTYKYANKPIYRVPVTAPKIFPPVEEKDYDACRNTFLWFGTRGFVHKGLDLVLEAFAGLPHLRLLVCGPIGTESDFEAAYREELYETPNIQVIGWVDVGTRRFREIADSCIALIYPSCSEGQSSAVVTCLHAGLIPVASYESGVDIRDEFGVTLRNSTIEEIREAILRIAGLPTPRLAEMSARARGFAQERHSREAFASAYRDVVRALATNRPPFMRATSRHTDWQAPR